jgi:hypothetical protein
VDDRDAVRSSFVFMLAMVGGSKPALVATLPPTVLACPPAQLRRSRRVAAVALARQTLV